MKRLIRNTGIGWLVVLAWSTAATAQLNPVLMAVECMETHQYARAYELWSALVEETDSTDFRRIQFARSAVQAAIESNQYPEALDWSSFVINQAEPTSRDWQVHVELLQYHGRGEEVPGLLQSERAAQFPAHKLQPIIANAQAVQKLHRDSTSFSICPFRPQATADEFAAVPLGAGLVFQSTAGDIGIAPRKDGRTGDYFTKLMFLSDTARPAVEFTWKELAQRKDQFLSLGRTRLHDGPVAFDAEQDFAALTRSYAGRDAGSNAEVVRLRMDFFWKRLWGWEPAHAFPWNSTEYSCGHGTFDADGNVVFMSDMPGGYGGMDLYHTRWEDAEWTHPENLGPAVNTAGNEAFPFMSPAGFLYFASDGHLGTGGLDVFVYPRGADRSERLGAPINSTADDFAFVWDDAAGEGWLSSNRTDEQDAIYRVSGPGTTGKIEVEVLACDGSPVTSAEVQFTDVQTGTIISAQTDDAGKAQLYAWLGHRYDVNLKPYKGMRSPPGQYVIPKDSISELVIDMNFASKENSLVVLNENGAPVEGVLLMFEDAHGHASNFITDERGQFEWRAVSQADDFVKVTAALINYNDLQHRFREPPSGCLISISDTLTLVPWNADLNRIDLANIFYDSGSSELREDSKIELDKLVSYMLDRPGIRVELSSHTDCRDDEDSNLLLSQARAESCVGYIIDQGIQPDRILAIGYGESQLLNQCSDAFTCGCAPLNVVGCEPCEEALHQQNRRTELRLLAD
jgi:outer membrane protein OmpA-like peptidoglycan-associated protein